MKLSGTYLPMDYLLEAAYRWVPGLVSVQSVFAVNAKLFLATHDSRIPLHADSLEHIRLRKLRERKSRYAWVSADFIDGQALSTGQLAIERELTYRFLALFLTNPLDQLADVVVLEFPEQANPFKIKSGEVGLSTNEKEQLGAFLSSLFVSEYQRIHDENKLMRQFSGGIQQLRNENRELLAEIERLKQERKDEFNYVLNSAIAQVEQNEMIGVRVNEQAFARLKALNLSEAELCTLLSRALRLELIGQFGADPVVVTPLYLDVSGAKSRNEGSSAIESKFDKALLLLNKYEEAARLLTEKGLLVNGKNIAARLEITPPALTDAIKKSAGKISILLMNYPEKWKLIRQFLKPIQRIGEDRKISA